MMWDLQTLRGQTANDETFYGPPFWVSLLILKDGIQEERGKIREVLSKPLRLNIRTAVMRMFGTV